MRRSALRRDRHRSLDRAETGRPSELADIDAIVAAPMLAPRSDLALVARAWRSPARSRC